MTTDAADLVLRGGAIHTVDDARPRATALAVRDGRIAAVGSDGEVVGRIGPRTRVIELRGRTVLPGFQDAHVHPVTSGLDKLRCDLFGVAGGRAGAIDAIRAYAVANPDLPWIVGSGWSMSDFPGGTPHRHDLDAAVGDRPAYLENRDGHSAWVSSRALSIAGIDATTPDPIGGRIERDPDGTPSGALHDGATTPVEILLPPTGDDERERGLRLAQGYLHSVGVTAWQDASVGPREQAAYQALDGRGELTGRVVGALWWDRNRGLEQVDELVARRQQLSLGRFVASSVKVMQDGVAENFTASMTQPYCDGHGHPTDNSGISFVPPDVLLPAAAALDTLGFQLHFHAIGDLAVRQCLDAVEHAIARNGRRDARHHIAHLQVVHPDDVPRFRELGVVANLQMLWAALEAQMVELTLPFLGEPRGSWQYPFGDLHRSGAMLAAGSDWSVSSADPLAALHVAVNRTVPEALRDDDVVHPAFLPEQRLDLATALTAYTSGSAHVNRLEHCGAIRPGALADLVVLDRDPFAGPPDEIAATRVLQTFVDGRRVHAAPDA